MFTIWSIIKISNTYKTYISYGNYVFYLYIFSQKRMIQVLMCAHRLHNGYAKQLVSFARNVLLFVWLKCFILVTTVCFYSLINHIRGINYQLCCVHYQFYTCWKQYSNIFDKLTKIIDTKCHLFIKIKNVYRKRISF